MQYVKVTIEQLWLGEKVVWLHDSQTTEGTVVAIMDGRVQLALQNNEGQTELFWAMPENLRIQLW